MNVMLTFFIKPAMILNKMTLWSWCLAMQNIGHQGREESNQAHEGHVLFSNMPIITGLIMTPSDNAFVLNHSNNSKVSVGYCPYPADCPYEESPACSARAA